MFTENPDFKNDLFKKLSACKIHRKTFKVLVIVTVIVNLFVVVVVVLVFVQDQGGR